MGRYIGCERGKTPQQIESDILEIARATAEYHEDAGTVSQLAVAEQVYIDFASIDNNVITEEQ